MNLPFATRGGEQLPGRPTGRGRPDHGLDPLIAFDIVVDVEQRFDVTFPNDRIMYAMLHSSRTLRDAVSGLTR
ncbi:hypothetical protein ACWCPF_36610 [Streptomyces sp. NPDC001858]